MKLSTRGRYGIHAMYDLALNADCGPQSIKAIAEATMEELCAVDGIGPAQARVIFDHYHKENNADEEDA